jgi:L-methionine (R)-S-oxide reductase
LPTERISPEGQRDRLTELSRLLERTPREGVLTEVCRWLRATDPRYHWVGIYAVRGSELYLVAWAGLQPTEHVRIPVDRGICGLAVREERTVIVPDVRKSPEYLACFLDTRSEIVVPIRQQGRVVGEIDIDGRHVGDYDRSDEAFLGKVAESLGPYLIS